MEISEEKFKWRWCYSCSKNGSQIDIYKIEMTDKDYTRTVYLCEDCLSDLANEVTKIKSRFKAV